MIIKLKCHKERNDSIRKVCNNEDLSFILHPRKKSGMMVCTCNLRTGEVEAGGSLESLASNPSSVSELQVQ